MVVVVVVVILSPHHVAVNVQQDPHSYIIVCHNRSALNFI